MRNGNGQRHTDGGARMREAAASRRGGRVVGSPGARAAAPTGTAAGASHAGSSRGSLLASARPSRRLAVFGGLALAILAIALVGPLASPYDPVATDYAAAFVQPSAAHWFGCDEMGRDTFSRVLSGARISVLLSLVAVALPLVIGTVVGSVSAQLGGAADAVFMRIADMFQAFPEIVLAVAIVGVAGPGLWNVVLAIFVVTWAKYARLARSLVLGLKESGFVATARMSGASTAQIVFRHELPHLVPQLLIMAVLDLGYVILAIASMSFLGLGIQQPTPEWGAMLSEARSYFGTDPALMVFPGLAIFVTVLVVNLFGSALAERLGQGRSDVTRLRASSEGDAALDVREREGAL
ncbi:MAG: ABC transporter permease subunit [Eggerthellaceae bacterium]|jgi:peptide/nickel transport system permease protein